MEADWDVLIVGRSYAGLSAALTLGRARRSVLVVGAGGPRNEAVAHTHGLLTRDGADPAEVIAAAEADLAPYPSVELVAGRVTEIQAVEGGFRASIGPRTTTATLVIVASGVNDHPPPIAGLAEHWGRGVFTCAYCDGYEHRDRPLAVVGDPAMTPHGARMLTGWSDQVTLFVDEIDPEVGADLTALGITIDHRPVVRVRGDGASVTAVELEGGTVVPVGAVFVGGVPIPNSQLAVALGCVVDDHGFVQVDEMRRTSVDGVWAIGDVNSMWHQMAIAIADGVKAGADANAVLLGRPPIA